MKIMNLYEISPLVLQKLIWIPTRLILWFFTHLEISGLDNLKGIKTNVIFACNHSSELDPFFVPASLPMFSRFSPIYYTSREKSFYSNSGWRQIFYGGLFFKTWGSYPVLVGLRDYEKSLATHVKIIKEGGNVCIFPEGGTTKDGLLRPAKGGLSYLAKTTRIPIVPVAIKGVFGMTMRDFLMRTRRIKVIFGKPVTIDELYQESFDRSLSEDVHKMMSQLVMNRISALGDIPHGAS